MAGPDVHPGAAGDDEGRAGVSTAVDADGAATDVEGVATDAAGGVEGAAAHAARQAASVATAAAERAARNVADFTTRAYPQPAPTCAVTARA